MTSSHTLGLPLQILLDTKVSFGDALQSPRFINSAKRRLAEKMAALCSKSNSNSNFTIETEFVKVVRARPGVFRGEWQFDSQPHLQVHKGAMKYGAARKVHVNFAGKYKSDININNNLNLSLNLNSESFF